MEQNLRIITKKVWNLIRVMFFMLKKGISKAKFITGLSMMIKRGKIAGKSLHNLLFHQHHNWVATTFHREPHHLYYTTPPPPAEEYEFNCTTTPQYPLSLFSTHLNIDGNDDKNINVAVTKALEMLTSANASPALPGFGKSPMVKELRITDSPFPLSIGDEDGQVDEAAEKFITRFYNGLRREN